MSLFKKAAKAEVAPKAAKKSTKLEVRIDGLEDLAEIDALIKSLTALKGTFEGTVKAAAFEKFVELAAEQGKRPENFVGVDGNATASIEARKRSTTSALSAEEQAMFAAEGIPTETVVLQQQLFAINPKYASDEAMLEKVSAAIESIVPEDFIMHQEEVLKVVVSDETIEQAFRKGASADVLRAVTVLGVKPKLSVTNLGKILDKVKGLIGA